VYGAAPLDFAELAAYGWDGRWDAHLAEVRVDRPDVEPGRVMRHDGSAVLVATGDGPPRQLPVPPGIDPDPLVGDWVAVDPARGTVAAVLPRSTFLRRQDPDGGEQGLVANLDALLIVCGLDRPVKSGRIARSIALAWDAGVVPAVVLTKIDLADDVGLEVASVEAEHPGIDVVATSVVSGAGLEAVHQLVRGRTIVLLGESGAGKSTLANALMGSDVAAIGEVREGDRRGRHTTTARQLHPLPGGGVLVDTPGIRSVGLWIDPDAVDATFADVDSLARACRFADCRHGNEPGCAVNEAIADGDLDPERLASWTALRREAESAAIRADPRASRAAARRWGKIAREAQQRKRP
jgi:ribosome biogenesis GTPase